MRSYPPPSRYFAQGLNRKTVTARMLEQYPAHLRLYDLLVADGEDLRPLPFVERRRRLETWHGAVQPPRSDLSELIAFHSFEQLDELFLLVFPVLLGAGKSLFSRADKDKQQLTLRESQAYPNGVLKLIYDVSD